MSKYKYSYLFYLINNYNYVLYALWPANIIKMECKAFFQVFSKGGILNSKFPVKDCTGSLDVNFEDCLSLVGTKPIEHSNLSPHQWDMGSQRVSMSMLLQFWYWGNISLRFYVHWTLDENSIYNIL